MASSKAPTAVAIFDLFLIYCGAMTSLSNLANFAEWEILKYYDSLFTCDMHAVHARVLVSAVPGEAETSAEAASCR
jgi:pyruvate/oxaloacetate carboxyltransferase